MDKIDLRIVKTYAKLTAALSEMMNEKPFDDITVFDLCERACVRRATFYKHFKDKYDFLREVTKRIIKECASSILASEKCNISAEEYLTKFVDEVIVYFEKNPSILSNMLDSNTFHVMFDIITDCTHSALIEKLIDANSLGANLTTDLMLTADFINGGIANILLEWLKNPTVEKNVLLIKIKEILAKMF